MKMMGHSYASVMKILIYSVTSTGQIKNKMTAIVDTSSVAMEELGCHWLVVR
jgi:hypothetical protein